MKAGSFAAAAATIVGFALVAGPTPASAETTAALEPTAGYANPVLMISGDDEASDLTLKTHQKPVKGNNETLSSFEIEGSGGFTAGAGCTVAGPRVMRCEMSRRRRSVSTVVDLGGGRDRLNLTPNNFIRASFDGGSGNDFIEASYVRFLILRGGSGDDAIHSYGELHGGPGDDTLTGTAIPEDFYGGPGKDTIFGLGGSDLIHADDGRPDGVINCGESGQHYADRDYAYVDPGDDPVTSCERVVVVRDNK